MDLPAPPQMETFLSMLPLLTIIALVSSVAVKFETRKHRSAAPSLHYPETQAYTDEHGAVVVPQWCLDIDAIRATDTGEKGRRAAAEHRDLHTFLDVEYDRDYELDWSEHCLSPREVSQIWGRQEASRWNGRWQDPHPNEVWKARYLAERFPARYPRYPRRRDSADSRSNLYSQETGHSVGSTVFQPAGYRILLAPAPSAGVWVSTLQRRRHYRTMNIREPPRRIRGLSLMEIPRIIPQYTSFLGNTLPKIWRAVREVWDLTNR